MPPSTLTADIERLQTSVNSLLALISHCQSSLLLSTSNVQSGLNPSPIADPTTSPAAPPSIPPLSLLHDSASLAKAHTTKLALLLTQSTLSSTCRAATTLISTFQTSVLPPFLTSLELLSTQNHGKALIRAVSRPMGEVLLGLQELIGGPLKTMVDEALREGASGKQEVIEKETVIRPTTGKIWASCDKLIGMQRKGLVGVAWDRLKISAETIEDAAEELASYCKKHTPSAIVGCSAATSASSANNSDLDESKEEDQEEDDDDEDDYWDDDDEFPSSGVSKKKRKSLPPHVITTINAATKRLKTISILFKAIHKRRLTGSGAPLPDPALTTTPSQDTVKRLDEMIDVAEELVILVDEVIGEYYELEGEEGDVIEGEKKLSTNERTLIKKAITLATLAEPAWDGSSDTASRLFQECAKAVQR